MANEHAPWFWRSDEQVAAYKNIGLPHPDRVFDINYDNFKKMTQHSPSELNQTIIHAMTRVQTHSGDEKLVYSMTERRILPIGNEKSFFRSNIGMYHVPIPDYHMKTGEYGESVKYVHGVSGRRVAYSIPFTKQNVEKLRRKGYCKTEQELITEAVNRDKAAEARRLVVRETDTSTAATKYCLKKVGQRGSLYIDSYQDWLTGDFNTLWTYGKANPTKEERDRQDSYNRTAAAALRMNQDTNVDPGDIIEKTKNAVDNALDKDRHVEGRPYR